MHAHRLKADKEAVRKSSAGVIEHTQKFEQERGRLQKEREAMLEAKRELVAEEDKIKHLKKDREEELARLRADEDVVRKAREEYAATVKRVEELDNGESIYESMTALVCSTPAPSSKDSTSALLLIERVDVYFFEEKPAC